MSETINIKSKAGDYKVIIGKNIYENKLNNKYLIDGNVNKIRDEIKVDHCIELNAIEDNKTLFSVARIIEELRRVGANRKSTLTVIGGGVTQDVGTFVASTFMRGLQWELVPTTLLSMVDSCIGGKSSINVGEFKNIAGNFYPPNSIIIDTNFCSTLSEKQIIEGLSECVKICYAHSEGKFLDYLEIIDDCKTIKDINFTKVVFLSLDAKKHFIEEDEFDTGIRLLLNFGHTFGHAIESACQYKIPHGISVALGIICSYLLSINFTPSLIDTRRAKTLVDYIVSLIGEVEGLKSDVLLIDIDKAMAAIESDKKHSDNAYYFIVFDSDGSLKRENYRKTDANREMIKDAFVSMKEIVREI